MSGNVLVEDLEAWCLTQASALDEDVRRREEDFLAKERPSESPSLSETIGYAVGLLWGNAQAAAYREVAGRVRVLRVDEAARSGRETVDHPAHYLTRGVECIEVVERLPFSLGNCVKYLWRAGEKSDRLEDLRKALWYARRAEAFSPFPAEWDEWVDGRVLDLMDRVQTREGESLRVVLAAIGACIRRNKTRSRTYADLCAAIEREIARVVSERATAKTSTTTMATTDARKGDATT